MEQALTVLLAIQGQNDDAIAALGAVEDKLDTLSNKVSDGVMGDKMNRVSDKLTELSGKTTEFLKDSVGQAADFNQKVDTLNGLMGKHAEDVGALHDKALELGKDTTFSAGEAIDVMTELSKAGMDATTIMEGGARATLDLATATDTDAMRAVEVLSDSMTSFHKEFEKSGESAAQVANKITQAANASTISVNDMGFSLSMSGAVATSLGIKYDDLATAIAVMGQNGLKGSDAGTSLKTMMLNLHPSTTAAADAMTRYGIVTEKTDAQIELLKKNGIALREENGRYIVNGKEFANQQDAINQGLFNMVGYQGDLSAANQKTLKEFKEQKEGLGLTSNAFFDANGNARSYAEIAQVLKDKLGDLTAEQQQAALKTMFGTDAIRAASILTREGADGVNKMNAAMNDQLDINTLANNRMNNLAGAMEQFNGSLETVKIVIGDTIGRALRPLVDMATNLLNLFLNAPPEVQNVVGILATLAGAFLALGGPIAFVISILPGLGATLAGAFAPMLPVAAVIAGIIAAVLLLKTAWDNNFLGIQDTVKAFWEGTLQPFLQQAAQWFQVAIPQALNLLQTLWAQVWQGIQATILPVLASVFGELAKFWTEIQPRLTEVWNFISGTLIPVAWNIISTVLLTGLNVLKNGWDMIWGGIVTVLQGIWNAIQGIIETAWALISGIIKVALDLLTGHWEAAWNHLVEMVNGVLNGLVHFIFGIGQALFGVIQTALGLIKGIWETFWNWAGTFLTGVWNGIVSFVKQAITDGKNNVEAGLNGIKNLWDSIWTAIHDRLMETLANIVIFVTQKVTEIKTFLENLPGQLASAAGNIGKAIIDGILNGLRNGAGAIRDFIVNMANGALDAIKQALGIHSPSAVMRDEVGGPIGAGVAQGIGASWQQVTQAFSTQTGATVQQLRGFGETAVQTVTTFMGLLGDTFKAGLDGVTALFAHEFAPIQEGGVIATLMFSRENGFFSEAQFFGETRRQLDWYRIELWQAAFDLLRQMLVTELGKIRAAVQQPSFAVGQSVAAQIAAGIRAGIPEIAAAYADAQNAAGGAGASGGGASGGGASGGASGGMAQQNSTTVNNNYNVRTAYINPASASGAQAQAAAMARNRG